MEILLTLLSPVDGSFIGEKAVTLPHYFMPMIHHGKYLEKDAVLDYIDPIFKEDVDFVVELI